MTRARSVLTPARAAPLLLLLVLLALAACAPAAAPTPAPPPTAMPAAPTPAPTQPAALATATAAPAAATPTPQVSALIKTVADASLGPILVDTKGMTLYRYTKDQAGLSNCYDQCAQNWPPLLAPTDQMATVLAAPGLPGTFATTTRKDGSKQVTYNGFPLYYWIKDAKPGDTTGQGVGNVWYVLKPGEIIAPEGQSAIKLANDPKLGEVLADANGWVLYRYTKDEPDVTNCYDQCARNWPPVMLTSDQVVAPSGLSGSLGLITRKDGSKQLTYNRMPLYYWVRDTKPGETTGQDVGKVWYVVKPGETPQMAAGAGTYR